MTALDFTETTGLIDRLTGTSLDELRLLHGRINDAERIVRALIREREAINRRDLSWRARELSIAGATP